MKSLEFLESLAKSIKFTNFPKEALIVQSDPEDEYCLFICLWQNQGDRKLTTMEIRGKMNEGKLT